VADPLTVVFDEFRDEVAPLVRSAGVARARETVRVRRRRRTVAVALLAVVAIAVPAATFPHARSKGLGTATQSGGPTAAPTVVISADLRVFTNNEIVFSGTEGIMELTIGNPGRSPVPYQVVFAMPVGAKLKTIEGGCAGPPAGYRGGNLACGGTVHPQTGLALTFTFTRTDARKQTSPITVHVRPSKGYTDPNLANNDVRFRVLYH
jgi:hypothetical protein